MTRQQGAIRLFRVWGIDVFLHWSWLLVGAIELQSRTNAYHTQFWNILEYLSLFGIVRCGARFDTIVHRAACPQCNGTFPATRCPFCGRSAALAAWYPAARGSVVAAPVARAIP